ncbi:MAG: PDZ domain-containing protein [Steroidobacteraceae bacterium]
MNTYLIKTMKAHLKADAVTWLAALLLQMLCVALLAIVTTAPVHAADSPQPAPTREQALRLRDAQDRFERSARDVAELNLSLLDGGRRVLINRIGAPPVILGINIEAQQSRAGDEGVRVLGVSAGGPADSAGIKANDVITSFDGKLLKSDADRSAAQQLLAALREAKPDQAVALEYRRDGKTFKAQVVPKALSDSLGSLAPPSLPDLPNPPAVGQGIGGGGAFFIDGRELNGLGTAELVELSPALGKYFGTDKGLLVVRAPKSSQFKLQDGDVILDIDGRVPGSVIHALQILRSYRAGETLKLHIMRQQKRVELNVTVPDANAGAQDRRFTPLQIDKAEVQS